MARIVIFLLGAITIFYAIYVREAFAAFIILIITFVVFGLIVNYHKRIKERSFFNEALSRINGDEIKRLHQDIDQFDSGINYLSEKHPYAYDLDIFGRYSIFQLISRAATPGGKDQLAGELKKHFTADEIRERQQAVKELSEKIDWRQKFQANGSPAKNIDPGTSHAISHWMQESFIFFSNKYWKPFLFGLWLLIAISLGLILAGQISFYWIFLFNVVNGIIMVPRLKRIHEFSAKLGKTDVLLNAYSKMLLNIEESEFDNIHLSVLREKLFSHKLNASHSIRKLNNIIGYLDNRANLFYVILNSFFLLDVYLIYQAEAWKAANRGHVEDWLDVVAKFESLASLAAFSYSNKSYCFPEISSEAHFISAKEVAHPLIKAEKRVSNDFNFSGRGAVALITGLFARRRLLFHYAMFSPV